MTSEEKIYGEVTTSTGVVYIKQCSKKKDRKKVMLFSRGEQYNSEFIPAMLTVNEAKKLRKILKRFIKENQ